MKITVGSSNQTKVQAVAEAVHECALFKDADVVGVDVQIEQFGHPIGIEAVVTGAMDRAKQAFKNSDLSFGIEGGLMAMPHSKTGYIEVAVCAIYDGVQFHLGTSSGYEWPKAVTDMIVHGGKDGSQAMREVGLTTHEKIGVAEGAVSILTKGKVNRTEFNKQAVLMALIHLENKEHY